MRIKKSFRFSKNLLLLLIITFVNLSCQSANLENKEKSAEIQKQYNVSQNYYNSFTEMSKNNCRDPEIKKLLQSWETEAPTGDFYLCYFTYYVNLGIVKEDNSNVSIPKNQACVIEGDYYIYRDFTVDRSLLSPGIDYLIQGLKKFPTRLDLWEKLMSIFANLGFHNDLANVICDFIDVVTASKEKGLIWYDVNEKSLSERKDCQGNSQLFIENIMKYGNYIVDYYPFPNAAKNYEKIYRKVVELYPYSAHAFNELGYGIGISNPEEALKCYEKAYKLDKTFTTALLNMAIYANILGDKVKIEKYTELLKATGDTKKIQFLEEQVYLLNKN